MWVDLDFFFSAQQELLHDDYTPPTHTKKTEKKKKHLDLKKETSLTVCHLNKVDINHILTDYFTDP